MPWWIWIVGAVACLVIEMMTPGSFVFAFFAVGCLGAGLGEVTHLAPEFWQQSMLAVVLACLGALLFRSRLVHLLGHRHDGPKVDSLIGECVMADTSMALGAEGNVIFRGTPWKARNVGASAIEAQGEAVIHAVEGITLLCKSKKESVG